MKTGWKWFWGVTALLVLLALVAGGAYYSEMRANGFFRDPVFETERPALPPLEHPAVLVFSKTNSFIHKEAIPAGKQLFEQIAAEQGASIFLSDSGGVFNPGDLAHFDVIVWNNVTGDVLTAQQRQAMRHWLEQGGGFLALHAGGDNSHEVWPWYLDTVIRARFIGHPLYPQFQQATLHIEQPADPIVAALEEDWVRTDEWYSFDNSPRASDVRVLATIDENTYSPGSFFGKPLAMGSDHPMIWKHCAGAGRVFYSALGHTAESYSDPKYREVLMRAIVWAGRLDPAAALPADPLICETN
ncbi:MAG: ThuA domain-containing protein [Gammaproteobacteria bacterium]|jgi:type 1 glutamine amidotransferase|nr:ThuA domain-containing protein [Gammaproteobacteria bacterium]MBP6051967.1 ThuA domain-containing protein [Pseudomonadales bacterium]MBK7169481.1 ThuA domain-containing protein [Gammaproteobacteria bacterium]MBK7520647.1 ThuA domain-containing protein [Gammaproteobacteria bacterium]MBK7728439.1 ThuA domain-containing protein [Gammaproteobacteria bacterium]